MSTNRSLENIEEEIENLEKSSIFKVKIKIEWLLKGFFFANFLLFFVSANISNFLYGKLDLDRLLISIVSLGFFGLLRSKRKKKE
jgi:hypothetical protein